MVSFNLFDSETRWRFKREIKSYSSLVLKKRPKSIRILIFAQGRTGSTLLESLLDSTGYFQGKGEVLGALNERVFFPIAYIKGFARRYSTENIVCHVKIYQLDKDRIEHGAKPADPKQFLEELHRDGWHIIALNRSDKFDHYISGCIARARGSYHKFDDQTEPLTIKIDRSELIAGIRNRQRLDRAEAAALAGVPHLAIGYERDLRTPELQQATLDRILCWIGLEPRPANTKLRKINSSSGADLIANIEQARAWSEEIGTG